MKFGGYMKRLLLSFLTLSLLAGNASAMQQQEPIQQVAPAAQRLIDQQIMARVKAVGDICGICREGFNNEQDVSILKCQLQAPHIFHAQCIQEWADQHQICPTCRTATPNPLPVYIENNSIARMARLLITNEFKNFPPIEGYAVALLGQGIRFTGNIAQQTISEILTDAALVSTAGLLIAHYGKRCMQTANQDRSVKDTLKGLVSLSQLKLIASAYLYLWTIMHLHPTHKNIPWMVHLCTIAIPITIARIFYSLVMVDDPQ